MNLSQFKPSKQHSFYERFDLRPQIRERNPGVKRDPTVLLVFITNTLEPIWIRCGQNGEPSTVTACNLQYNPAFRWAEYTKFRI
jgi:hypothetical protein